MTDPMERTCSNDRYYLVAYSKKHNNFTHYSVGRMEKVEVEDVTNEYDKERSQDIHASSSFPRQMGSTMALSSTMEMIRRIKE